MNIERSVGTSPAAHGSVLERTAGLLVDAYPDVDPQAVVDIVRGWGRRLAARLAPDVSPLNRLRMLHHFFFEELRFRGNVDAFDDADNSYLNRVVERRTGIPISLAVVYVEIGRAIGLRLAGVGFPGHFLVRLSLAEGPAIIDVFGLGAVLSEHELRARLAAVLGDQRAPLHAYLRPASSDEIVVRWLRNLLALHRTAGNWGQVLKVASRLLAVAPLAADERLVRAQAYERLECPRAAADDLERYLELRPQATDADALRAALTRLRGAIRTLH